MNLNKIISTLLLVGSLSAQETSQEVPQEQALETVSQRFGYVGLGLAGPFPGPSVTLGYRLQSGHHGADFSLQVSSLSFPLGFDTISWIPIPLCQANLLYLYYLTPDLDSEWYVGGGVSPACIAYSPDLLMISPQIAFGKQYCTNHGRLRFLHAQIGVPIMYINHHPQVLPIPMFTVSYGIGF